MPPNNTKDDAETTPTCPACGHGKDRHHYSVLYPGLPAWTQVRHSVCNVWPVYQLKDVTEGLVSSQCKCTYYSEEVHDG